MSIELCNLRKEKPKHPWDVKVDRSSVLGNPFTTGTREEQCRRYDEMFRSEQKMPNKKAVLTELKRLIRLHDQYGKLRLFCWCVPLQCHSETIKAFLEEARADNEAWHKEIREKYPNL